MLSNLYKNKHNVKVFIDEYYIILTLPWYGNWIAWCRHVTSWTSRDGCVLSACSIFSSPVQSTGRAIVLTLASAFAFVLAFPSRHF